MPSLVQDYEYDIFISYRQKDNKYDGWVTEFVSNLKKELEATFKEDITIYFDLNPHDGLLSTHDVEKSLERKLKCLIIIPVLSHTYCDPKSYAWQYEFCAFNKLAREDPFGRDVKLLNGNVASRILPVKIHHLDNIDLKLLQGETGSVLRSIDFIYEEPGVNRPLRPRDEKRDNANKTDYRNQINKVANAIKEILGGLKNDGSIGVTQERSEPSAYKPEHRADKSIAVLPFSNLSNDPAQEYFSEGIAEEIINSLVHLQDLKVAGRVSSLQFKGVQPDLREVGGKLGVSNVLVGSVRKQDKRLRVTAQLISVEDGFNLWSEKYDRHMDDIFTIQEEIALAITEKLKVTLLETERDRITRSYTQNHEAYELFLKGRFHINKRGASILTGIQYFQKAIDVDPGYALAHAGYADSNLLCAAYGLVPARLVMNKIKQAADTALRLDASLCEPYCSLGYYYNCIAWNWGEAKKYFLKSLEVNPNYAQAHYWYGWNYLTWVTGEFDEAERHGKIAISLEPLSAVCYGTCSLILRAAGKYQEALEISQKGIELDPSSYLCQLSEGYAYMSMRHYEASITSYEMALKISNRHHFAVNGLIWSHCAIGNIEKGKSLMAELRERSLKEHIGFAFTGISAFYLNDLDFAFECLEKAFSDLDPVILTLKYDKYVPPALREHPRFQNILDRIGFPG